MSTQSTNYSEPRIVGDGFGTFASGHPPEAEGKFWEEVHEEVQRMLAVLDESVCARAVDARVTPGKTRGRAFFLFTYRTYSRTDADLDPVVVGLTFTAADDGAHVVIQADISGESSGVVIALLAPREVPEPRDELLRAARETAQELCKHSQTIVTALLDSSRPA